jgi:hypothetical protein
MLLAMPVSLPNDMPKCSIPDAERYFDVGLDRTYDLRRDAKSIVQALYWGPLMREGDSLGIADMMRLLSRSNRIRVRRIRKIVQGHLYGESNEFRELLSRLEKQYGRRQASFRILRSSCKAFGLEARSKDVMARDACLIANGKAHWVVTKMIVAFIELRSRETDKQRPE